MKKIGYVIILTFINSFSHAQLIDNKLDIQAGYLWGTFHGSEVIHDNNFIAPSLYSNFRISSGISLSGRYNFGKHLSPGLNFRYQHASDWVLSGYTDFTNSEVRLYSISPIIRIHTATMDKGLLNRMQLYLDSGPTFGVSDLIITRELFDIQSDNPVISPPLTDQNTFWGLDATIGIMYSAWQSLGLFISYSYDINWISSKLYIDKAFIHSAVSAGLVLRFYKNKYIYQ